MTESSKSEFIERISANSKVNGLDELPSKLIGILYAEPREIDLDDLAKRTGYSLSAVSTAMKFVERAGIVKRLKKPKSRKVYFYMEKDIISMFTQLLRRKYESIILPSKHKLPKIIEGYKLKGSEDLEEELKIVENYYEQILFSEQIIKELLEAFDGYEVKK